MVAQAIEFQNWQAEAVDFGDVMLAYRRLFHDPIVANGQSALTREIRLTKNALVESYPAVVRASVALWAPAQAVASVREQAAQKQIVIDFGLLRTVNGVVVQASEAFAVFGWTGLDFSRVIALENNMGLFRDGSRGATFTETRAERLCLIFATWPSAADLASKVLVGLPETPGNLELRVGTTRVWSFPGPVPTDSGNAPSEFTVDLGSALTELCADPLALKNPTLDADKDSFQVVLSAGTPGALALELPASGRSLAYIFRATSGFDDGKKTLTVAEEGEYEVPLALPTWAKKVKAASLMLAGKPAPTRILPPVGPSALDVAELVVEATRAACTELVNDGEELAELEALRLCLRAEAEGAEVRLLLLEPGAQPGAPLPQGASEPVILDGGASATWVTFPFKRPFELSGSGRPWIALVASRGRVVWSLGSGIEAGKTRRGSPAGPWFILPQIGGLAQARALVRRVGKGRPETPIAAFKCRLAGAGGESSAVAVTPTEKGLRVELKLDQPIAVEGSGDGKFVRLKLVARATGSFTLSNVDLTLLP